jgi:hypothetical protein
MPSSERAAAKHEAEYQEALGHLVFFKNQRPALEYAITKMKEDLRLCEKNVKIWEGRIEAMKAKAARIVEVLG